MHLYEESSLNILRNISFVFLLGLESIIFHYTFKATQGLIVSRFCVQASKTFSLAWQHKFFSALFTITQKVNKDIKYPNKTLKGKCVCSLCTASQLSGGFSSQVWRGLSREEGSQLVGQNKSTPDRAVCSMLTLSNKQKAVCRWEISLLASTGHSVTING